MKKPVSTRARSPVTAETPTHNDVARLAHAIYEEQGRPHGKHLEHWFNAESMIEANFGYGQSHKEHDFSKERP